MSLQNPHAVKILALQAGSTVAAGWSGRDGSRTSEKQETSETEGCL